MMRHTEATKLCISEAKKLWWMGITPVGCKVERCNHPHHARGWCKLHYERWRVHGNPDVTKKLPNGTHETCTIEGCDKPHRSSGWCTMHWTRWSRYGDPTIKLRLAAGEIEVCTIDGCLRSHRSSGLCHIHYNSIIAKPKRHALQNGAEIVDFTPKQWEQIKMDFNHCCAYCGNQVELEQDHVVPISKGGNHTAANIVPACRSCNARKGNRRWAA